MSEEQEMVRAGSSTRYLWLTIASLEFAATMLVGALLWLFVALYWAACLYAKAVGSALQRATALWELRVKYGRALPREALQETARPTPLIEKPTSGVLLDAVDSVRM